MIEFRVVSDEYREQATSPKRGRYAPLLSALDSGATVFVPTEPTGEEGRLIRNRLGNAASMRGVRFRYGPRVTAEGAGMVVWFEEK